MGFSLSHFSRCLQRISRTELQRPWALAGLCPCVQRRSGLGVTAAGASEPGRVRSAGGHTPAPCWPFRPQFPLLSFPLSQASLVFSMKLLQLHPPLLPPQVKIYFGLIPAPKGLCGSNGATVGVYSCCVLCGPPCPGPGDS